MATDYQSEILSRHSVSREVNTLAFFVSAYVFKSHECPLNGAGWSHGGIKIDSLIPRRLEPSLSKANGPFARSSPVRLG